jgi:hypothetical protein
MNFIYYISIYGLAEALAVSVLLTLFFGIQWWRIRRKQKIHEQFCDAILNRFKEEILRIQAQSNLRPELRDGQLAALKAIAVPLKNCQLNSPVVWEKVVRHLEHYFEYLAQLVPKNMLPQAGGTAQKTEHTIIIDGIPANEQLDLAIDDLLAHYQAAASAIVINQEAAAEMKHSYEQLQFSNQELRAQIQADRDKDIWEKFDAYEQSNAAFMRALSVKERNYKILIKEHESLQIHIHNLNVRINEYRKNTHQLILKQDALTEENKLLREQQESTNHLVSRLNHDYDTLRIEYTKLFEKMQ